MLFRSGASLALALDLDHGIACSVGSACTSGSDEPSHVLTALGYPPDEARGALRLSLGPATSEVEIEAVAAALPLALGLLRSGSAPVAPR